eukprot:m.26639 g.26639  ORF g.26639 m.26639 type:complete len:223 (+) comp5873_c0_seq1:80-748(+)
MSYLPEDQYGEIITDDLLRWWLSIDIPRQLAEQSLSTPSLAPTGSYIVRRSLSSPGNYAITVVQGNKITSYEILDMGLGQVSLRNGRCFASLQDLLEHFYTLPFPDEGPGHVALQAAHSNIVGKTQQIIAMRPPVPYHQQQQQQQQGAMYEVIDQEQKNGIMAQADDGMYGEIDDNTSKFFQQMDKFLFNFVRYIAHMKMPIPFFFFALLHRFQVVLQTRGW